MIFETIVSCSKIKIENKQPKGEIEQITTDLIEETKIILKKQYDEIMSKHSEPLSEDEARIILNGLIKEAVAQRKIMIGRIEKSVEAGTLFDRYYGKMQTINALTNSAYAQMQKMDRVREKYDYQQKIHKKLTRMMYDPTALPDDTPSKDRGNTVRKDVWGELDEKKKISEEKKG